MISTLKNLIKPFRKNSLLMVLILSVFINAGCYKISQQIPLPKPEPDFYFDSDTAYIAPCEVFFQNKSYYATSFDWDFNDGRIYTSQDQIYYFNDAGNYTITLTAKNVDGASVSITKNIEILPSIVIPHKHKYDGKWQVSNPDQESSDLAFQSFEFSNNRCIVEFAKQKFQYGKLYYSDSYVNMEGLGNCKVSSYTENQMSVLIDEVLYNLVRQIPVIELTEAALRLTNGYWMHTQKQDTISTGDEWLFTSAGTFVSLNSGHSSFMNYNFNTNSNINIQGQEEILLEINELTLTRLIVSDEANQSYKLNTQVY